MRSRLHLPYSTNARDMLYLPYARGSTKQSSSALGRQRCQRLGQLEMGVRFGDKDAAVGHVVGGRRPEVTMNSIGGQRPRTAATSFMPSIDPGMLTSVAYSLWNALNTAFL